MYKSMLIPLDGSKLAEAILPEVEVLALTLKAKLYLIRVSRAQVLPGRDPTDSQVKVVRRAEEYLEELKNRLSARHADIQIHAPYGSPADKILEVCRRQGIDMIAMSTMRPVRNETRLRMPITMQADKSMDIMNISADIAHRITPPITTVNPMNPAAENKVPTTNRTIFLMLHLFP